MLEQVNSVKCLGCNLTNNKDYEVPFKIQNYNKALRIINQVFIAPHFLREARMKFAKLLPDPPSVMKVKNGSFEQRRNATSQLIK